MQIHNFDSEQAILNALTALDVNGRLTGYIMEVEAAIATIEQFDRYLFNVANMYGNEFEEDNIDFEE